MIQFNMIPIKLFKGTIPSYNHGLIKEKRHNPFSELYSIVENCFSIRHPTFIFISKSII